MNRKQLYITIATSIAFLALNSYAISREFFLLPLLSVGVVLLYMLIYKLDTLLYIMAFATPFSIPFQNAKINLSLSMPTEVIMVSATLLFVLRILYDLRYDRRVLKHPITLALFGYLIWMLITCITSELPGVSFKYLSSTLWLITSSYFLVILLIRKKFQDAINYMSCYLAGLAIVIIIVTIKFALWGFPERGMHWVMSPFYNDHTAYGAAIAFMLPFSIAFIFLKENTKQRRIFYITTTLILLMALYLSYCRAAWLSVIIFTGVWLAIRMRIKFSWLLTGGALIFLTFFYFADDILYKMEKNTQDSSGNFVEHVKSISNIKTDASNVERLNRWDAGFRMIKERPIAGWGPGTYQFLYAPYQRVKYRTIISTNFGDVGSAHSEYIRPCVESGFIGLLTTVLLFFIVIYYGITTHIRLKNHTARLLTLAATLALISYYTHGILNNFLETDKLALPYWGAIAIIVLMNLYLKEENNKHRIKTIENKEL